MRYIMTYEDMPERIHELHRGVFVDQNPHLSHPCCRIVTVHVQREILRITGRVGAN